MTAGNSKTGFLFLACSFMFGFGYLTVKAFQYHDVLGTMVFGTITAGIGSYIYLWHWLPFWYNLREKRTFTSVNKDSE